MTDNSFDKFIKDKLDNYPSPVPDGLWEKIKQEKDKKPVGFTWMKNYGFAFIGIATILFGTTLFFNNDYKNEATLLENPQPAVQQNPKQNQISALQRPQSSANRVNDLFSQSEEKDDKATNRSTADQPTSSSNAVAENKTSLPEQLTQGTSNLRQNQFVKNASGESNFSTKKLFAPLVYNDQNALTEKSSSNHFDQLFNKHVLLSTIETGKNHHIFSSNDRLLAALKDYKIFGLDCPTTRGPVRNDIYIELYGSPDYAKKMINNAGSANSAFLERKDSTESMRLSFTAGFRLTKTIGENLVVKSGLQFSQINEKFSYRNENERKVTTVITIRTVIRSPGDTVMVRDTSTVEQIGYRVKTTYNRYRSIDLPLLAGYEWGNDKFKAAVTGGVILNLYSWQKGESLDTSYLPVSFNKGSGQTFKQNIGLGLYAGISLLKKVGEKTELFMEPYFRYNISNMTNNKSLFNQKFRVAGVNLGVRYKLNGFRQR